jgi:hypothetical protein
MPLALFFYKKNPKKKRTKNEVAGHPSIYLYIFLVFFGIFFLEKKVMGAFWE